MKKDEMLAHWNEIAGKSTAPELNPDAVPYKHEGSTYDQDGIRITGSRDWIDSVLYRLRDLLKFENGTTRLQVVYKQSTDRNTQQQIDGWNCYIQVHERGQEAQMMNAFIEGARARSKAREEARLTA
jgi:hypothetical protein